MIRADKTIISSDTRFGHRRFQIAFVISMIAVSVQFLIFVAHGLINRRWEGEFGGYFVGPAIIIFFGIIMGGGIIWFLGFKTLRLVSRLIYLIFGRNRVEFSEWDRVFCRSLRPLPWSFGIGAIVYITYFAADLGGSPDDVIVGTIGNILGAICYGTIFFNWYQLCTRPDTNKRTEQVGDGDAEEAV